jgi:hypothetical protein
MAVVPSKDPRYNFDIVPDPPAERFLSGAIGVVVSIAVLLVAAAVLVWAWRTVFA